MRVALIVFLLFQILVAQAGGLGMAENHDRGTAGHDTISFAHSHAASGSHAPAKTPGDHDGETDASHTHERCCCAFTGHCSSSAVATQAQHGTPSSPAAHGATPVTTGLASGFDSPPYRPPSFL